MYEDGSSGVHELANKVLDLINDRNFWIPIEQPFLTLEEELRSTPFSIISHKEIAARAAQHSIGPNKIRSLLNYLCQSGCLVSTKRNFIPDAEPPHSFGGFDKNLMSNPMDPLDILPVEMQCQIFSHLDVFSILNAERVSKKWNGYVLLLIFVD